MNETIKTPRCGGCGKPPCEIDEYVYAAIDCGTSPEEYVRREEGTYNSRTGAFLCTECYIAAGEPSHPRGWIAP